ncbi:bifunctional diaminohydroxyphosphoribosylaminopyrimidine deaminase/5-amino-6-(5-phosphoribosylamino)uracil reductase RibD [Polycladomyces subterraneus]|uniref:Riboflavin biosynthesis protein RibD n=1 Tax=Polycladomyces subterraneus TaxID=1016997 RepID=A0ABT8IMW4_9BACL|nr:bifunctional diaminohydroxyphosphoribosylaminopyrimidine deaminase/5-amino-6-(5-phosphoribosylamino)uracil reductase RibD [Polycladomyces subterraneus]MDN4594143.1 bifunctional diaminohydroxyphosphoribosylaminopyrimidine deaminase/5-amino-6-(5-phosphoribosylamino)uracil reductase RibD [Polycladomyces subterraneus]
MEHHEKWMRLALHLARSAEGQTSPNPLVGAVAVKNGRLIGMGAHLRAGTPHAEVHALDMAGPEAAGSTLYVTLEPCNHYGRTPPCTEKVIASGVKTVVIGSKDPDPRVAGSGIRRLQEAGVEVVMGVLETECLRLNEAYFHHRRTGRPFITLKTASTLDGKIATHTGHSRWVTGEAARAEVHRLRHIHDAIMVGVGTVLADKPRLTTRLPGGGRNPIRVVIDSRLRLPLDTPVADVTEAPTWVFCTDERDLNQEEQLRAKGVKIVPTGPGPRVDLNRVMQVLGEHGVLSVLVEGGGTLNAALLREQLVDKVIAFVAPKLLGGQNSPTSVEGQERETMAEAIHLRDLEVQRFGEDLCVIGYPVFPS